MSRTDSGFADIGLRKSIDRPLITGADAKRNSHSNHNSRRSSRSSSRPSMSHFTGDLPRHQRPALHSYKSSTSSQRASTTEELNALYIRSCALMRSNSTSNGGCLDFSPPPGPTSEKSSIRSQPISITSDPTATISTRSTLPTARLTVESSAFIGSSGLTQSQLAEPRSPTVEPVPQEVTAPTTTHWLSPETRAKQYAEIEKSCKGWRGFWKKTTRSEKKARQTQDHLIDFYDEKNEDDGGSIRRYRVDFENEYDEKGDDVKVQRLESGKAKEKRKGWLGGRR